MEPMYLSIQQKETGKQIKKLLMENGYTVRDVQSVMGFENPQAIYKWISGRSLPSLDNFVILSRLLHTSIEDILVIDGDVARLRVCFLSHFSIILKVCIMIFELKLFGGLFFSKFTNICIGYIRNQKKKIKNWKI